MCTYMMHLHGASMNIPPAGMLGCICMHLHNSEVHCNTLEYLYDSNCYVYKICACSGACIYTP